MARVELSTNESRLVQDRLELAARSIFQIRHLPAPDSITISQIVGKAMASVSPTELRQSGGLSDALLGRVAGLIENTVQSGAPRNIFAGPDARQGDGPGGTRFGPGGGFGKGYHADLGAALAAHRNEAGDGGGSSGSGASRSNSNAYNQAFMGAAGDPGFLRSQGLTPQVGKALAGLGFKSPEQIKQIVADARQIGLPPAAAAVPLGTIRKLEGADRTRAMVKAWQGYRSDLERARDFGKLASRTDDPAKKAEYKRQEAEAKKAAEEKIRRETERNLRTQKAKRAAEEVTRKIRQDVERAGANNDAIKGFHAKSQRDWLSERQHSPGSGAIEDRKKRDVASAERPEAKKLAAGDAFLALGEKQPEGNPLEKPKVARSESAKPDPTKPEAAKPDSAKPGAVKKPEPAKPTRMAGGSKAPSVG